MTVLATTTFYDFLVENDGKFIMKADPNLDPMEEHNRLRSAADKLRENIRKEEMEEMVEVQVSFATLRASIREVKVI